MLNDEKIKNRIWTKLSIEIIWIQHFTWVKNNVDLAGIQ